MVKRKLKQVDEPWLYIVKIMDWELEYGINFHPERSRDFDPETCYLTLLGKLISPEKIAGRGLNLHFTACRSMTFLFNENSTHKFMEFNSVGGLHLRGERGTFWTKIPHDMLSTILTGV